MEDYTKLVTACNNGVEEGMVVHTNSPKARNTRKTNVQLILFPAQQQLCLLRAQQMFGAVAKTYYAKLLGVSPENIFSISVMSCVAKKHECALPDMNDAGAGQDVDVSLTTREVDRLIRHLIFCP